MRYRRTIKRAHASFLWSMAWAALEKQSHGRERKGRELCPMPPALVILKWIPCLFMVINDPVRK